MPSRLRQFYSIILLLGVVSCASNTPETVVYSSTSDEVLTEDSFIESNTPEELLNESDPFVRQRILADMLYEGRVAFDDNRLMSPPGNNAYDIYRSILDFDPDNEVALQGIRDIVQRYIQLADAAMEVRQFDNAANYLNRATRINGNVPAIAEARSRLAQAREIKLDIFALNGQALTERSLEIMVELGEIGQYIRDLEATFMINARTDEEGRWIYRIMREAVGGYRLRGNIAVDSTPSIQVLVPQS